ncbi:hypothetical protein ACFQU7_18925 [Pseudoroseomonas wenyumeiae]
MGKPLAARDGNLPNVTQAVRNEAADALRRLGMQASLRVFETSPRAALLVEVASVTMDYRDFIGRRSVGVTAWVSGQPVQPPAYDEMQQHTGRMEQAWIGAQRLIAAMPESTRLQQVLQQQKGCRSRTRPAGARCWPRRAAAWAAVPSPGALPCRNSALVAAFPGRDPHPA